MTRIVSSSSVRGWRRSLLDLQIADVMTSSAKGGQQLRFVVLKSLPPLGMACTDGENLALKMQWAAVGCELFPCDGGPVLPQTGESSTNPPLLAEFVQTVAQRGRGRWRSLLQHLKTLEAPALRFRSDCHGLRLKGRPAEISLLSSRVPLPHGFSTNSAVWCAPTPTLL